MRFLYFGLPLGAEILRRAGYVPVVASFGHLTMPGLRRARMRLDVPRWRGSPVGAPGERTLLLGKPDLSDEGVVRALESTRPDVLLSWFWPNRIPERVLALAPRGAFGVHPSLLPRHRGPDPYFHAIAQGDAVSGATLHRLAAEYDTGNLIASKSIPIRSTDTAWSLARRIDRPSLALLVECVERLAQGEALEGAPQDESLATQAEQPDEEALSLDWDRPADELARLVRAAAPAPMAGMLLGDQMVLVAKARVYDGAVPDVLDPGDAWRTSDGVVVVTGDGALLLEVVEDEAGERYVGRAIDSFLA